MMAAARHHDSNRIDSSPPTIAATRSMFASVAGGCTGNDHRIIATFGAVGRQAPKCAEAADKPVAQGPG
ncbi:hypothetical protein ABT297_00125 [Dactylosporangium sp. NPDC000555]|uniref:hypothetical protein n=1 Tax=Dactylosporangium sp. NPDC000555 TaxID=3154260 RepID=UPI00332B0F86